MGSREQRETLPGIASRQRWTTHGGDRGLTHSGDHDYFIFSSRRDANRARLVIVFLISGGSVGQRWAMKAKSGPIGGQGSGAAFAPPAAQAAVSPGEFA